MSLNPATAKECKGPCLYWCTKKNHVTAACVLVMVFAVGVGVGALIATACKKRRTKNLGE